jgi:alpha,alpha-trehalase
MQKLIHLTTLVLLAGFIRIQAQVKPAEVYDSLFYQVQLDTIFSDSKLFPDCKAVDSPRALLNKFYEERDSAGFDLKAFVLRNFSLPEAYGTLYQTKEEESITAHIQELWPVLIRQPDPQYPYSSLIALPESYVVPGGRFREIYYWDSYFTMLGLGESGRIDLVKDMIDNFTFLINEFGFIPNGNRTYYLSRSQPPFYSLMVALLGELGEEAAMLTYREEVEKEYNFWMRGRELLQEPGDAVRNVVMLPDSSVLNRYWDEEVRPRPESFREDFELARETDRPEGELYRDIRAAAESGWDFSSRWFAGDDLASIQTTQIVPVDLNALLYHSEKLLQQLYLLVSDQENANYYGMLARKRQAAMEQYLWNEKIKTYSDYNLSESKVSDQITMAAAFPLYFEMAAGDRIESTRQALLQNLEKPGGFVTTTVNSGEQWDAPNGWPPLQYIGIMALQKNGFRKDAARVAGKWLALNENVYQRTGKMMEKYNVVNLGLEAGGGEYPLQDGFGWTNGVYLRLKAVFDPEEQVVSEKQE